MMCVSVVLAIFLPHLFVVASSGHTASAATVQLSGVACDLHRDHADLFLLSQTQALLLDVFVLSGLYTVRILAGSSATGCADLHLACGLQRVLFPSRWLL